MGKGTLNFLAGVYVHENERERELVEKIKEEFERALGKRINLLIPKSYREELTLHETEDIDLYYANSLMAFKQFREGYVPFRVRGKETEVFALAGRLKEDFVVVSAPYLEGYLVTLFLIKELDLLRPEIIYTELEEEAYREVLEGTADLCLIHRESYELFRRKHGEIPLLKEIETSLSNYLTVKGELYREEEEKLSGLGTCVKLEPEEFKRALSFGFSMEELAKLKLFFDVSKALYQNEYTGTVIYRDRILYASKNVEKITGYSLRELQEMSILDFIEESDEVKRAMLRTIEERKRGGYFLKLYPTLKIRTRRGEARYIRVFSKTVIYNYQHCGMLIFHEITPEVMRQKVYRALRNINKAITTVLTQKELYQTVCETLVREFDIKFAWIGRVDEEGNLEELHSCGEGLDYLKHVNFSKAALLSSNYPTCVAYREGRVVINPSTEENPSAETYREEMLKRGFLSSAAIPIKLKDRVVAVLNVYASVPNFFAEDVRDLLEEIQRDLSFALEKIHTIRDSILLKQAVEKAREGVLITDGEGNILYVNDFICELTGYSREELIRKNPRIFKSGYHPKEFYQHLWETILSGKEFNAVFVNRKKNGELFYVEQKIVPVELPGGHRRFVALWRDITKETLLSEENERLRYYDILTGLLNFGGFKVNAENLISEGVGTSALLLIDLANFSYINKTYGSEAGDRVLKEVGERLRARVKERDLVGRIGGDEFGLFLTELKDVKDIFSIMERIKAVLRDEIKINGASLTLNFHGGVAIFPQDGEDFKTLIENASVALRFSKEEGINNIKLFNRELEEEAKKFLYRESLLERALREKLFVFHYQPYFDTRNGRLAGFEALLRIRERDGTLHYPAEFIDYLEKFQHLSGYIDWALKEVSLKIKSWNVPISLNVSARAFKEPSFPEKVLSHARELSQPLIVEITERLYMEDMERSRKIIGRLKESEKVRIAIDDFGTGYSSLSYIKDINADILKIDMSFTKAMVEDEKARAVVEAIVHLARLLGMKTLAEGVETKEQYELVRDMGIDYAQGFYLAKPLPEEEAEKLL
ncbi:PAS domain S-box-containing protein/diguanylate cyclase (GGDEF)-like protein [Hydrogenivirga caldilitoris]|uniref:PAS domain S-box-containing protein/diguanylate cyclase (GGDEF)-like protein n=1 Tax=Hydrogenivirga caldilitoris TaxID=246264 RepID=A0A497XPE6_9AQUI|nr:EAL domain-containing protein [Hydrogenivirga caldilitoris]RLJ70141.1 PAS domain S-box-containing protein/diguanylate cyclase (GGDEF)-like protein [Hydrogenivirga caldilitoris]